ncbi:MAG TPA: LacI family DNA-binding transcriptional regulator [Chthoniobacterales bacterium]|nr:LacI family DNA-binding transcriptional regulator [Chthoniobacterales bacterium]
MHEVLKQRVTLLDIAADAGVSRATVSLVIRNVPSVAESTRKRVERSIKRLGYVYHRGAASLRTQQSHAIGLIVSDITNPFFAEIIVAIEERLATARLVTLLGNTSEDHAKEERLLKTMREFPADGILICPAISRDTSTGTPNLAGRLPTVAFARRVDGIDYAGVDNVQGSQLAIEHLCQLGNRRIAFIGGDPEVSTGQERIQGYKRALVRSGLQFDRSLVVPAPPTRRGGYDVVLQLLQMENPPTAALCFNDVVALGAIEALQQAGVRAGKQFGVVGFNNVPDAAQSLPGLTTVDTSPRELGETAAELLLKRIEQRDSPIRTVILQPRLIVRQSCGTH